MPEICRFNGIRITMYAGDREHPPPHFHAEYGDHDASICIKTGAVLQGRIPSHCMKLIRAWRCKYQSDLELNWKLARDRAELKSIPPL